MNRVFVAVVRSTNVVVEENRILHLKMYESVGVISPDK